MMELLTDAKSIAPAVIFSLIVAAVAVFELIRRWISSFIRKTRAQIRSRRARAGELAAEDLLRELGYKIIERQPRQRYEIEVDGIPQIITLRADLFVARSNSVTQTKTFVVEVKTGSWAPRIENKNTRRQLLEYLVAYEDADGVLLVDAEAGKVQEILFPMPAHDKRSQWLPVAIAIALTSTMWLALGIVFGV